MDWTAIQSANGPDGFVLACVNTLKKFHGCGGGPGVGMLAGVLAGLR